MKEQMLYKELAKYYDLIYSKKDYRKEAQKIKSLILKHKSCDGKMLLDVACGSASHLKHLQRYFDCTGVDISSQMLKIAKAKAPKARFVRADMAKMSLGKQFDVLLCMFSAIGYARTYSNLEKIIRNFSRHLRKSGVLIIQPWLSKKDFHHGRIFMETYDGKEIKVARLSFSKVKSNISIVDMHYLIAEQARGIRYFKDRHVLGLFDEQRTLSIMKKAGFKAKYIPKVFGERGIYLGIKI